MPEAAKSEDITPVQPANEESAHLEHFWVSTYPYFQSTLFLIPADQRPDRRQGQDLGETSCETASPETVSPETAQAKLRLYDPDGALLNEVGVSCPAHSPAVFEIEPFLEGCKLESGLKHGHLVVESDAPLRSLVRYHTADNATFSSAFVGITEETAGFFPITCSAERENIFVVLNPLAEAATVRCRLYCGKRKPEHTLLVPALGVRLLSVESVFREYFDADALGVQQCYLRIGTREKEPLRVQVLERNAVENERSFFSLVS